jgi:hypothetical protein
MSLVEERARLVWKRDARQIYFGRCDVCGRTEDSEGRPLLVARQRRRRYRECVACWEARQ